VIQVSSRSGNIRFEDLSQLAQENAMKTATQVSTKTVLLVKPAQAQIRALMGKIDTIAVAGSTCNCGCSCHIDVA
jgi:hypothetical protein